MEKMMKYPVVIHKDINSDYGVTFPDIPGCFSIGTSIEEALAMAQEAAECHIEGMLLDSEPIPVPTSIESHRDNPNYKDGLWALVDIDISKLSLKAKRVNITIPERLLNTVDNYARNHGNLRYNLCLRRIFRVSHTF
jgi:predicted RNase H-like HicB family nuclease